MYTIIDKLISGGLSETEEDQIWEAMMKDPDLFSYYRTQIGLISELNQSAQKPSKAQPLRKKQWFIAIAAVLMIAVTTFLLVESKKQNDLLNDFLALNPYDIETLENYRSDSLTKSDFAKRANNAISKLVTKDYLTATRLYDELLEEPIINNETKAKLHFNKALVSYALESYDESEVHLNQASLLSTRENLIVKINCAKLKILLVQEQFEEAKTYAKECVINSSIPTEQKMLIKKLILSDN